MLGSEKVDYMDLKKILLQDSPSTCLRNCMGDLAKIIPEFSATYDFLQNSPWHVYDVFEHTLHVVDGVDSNIVLRMAALFHDIGKPFTYSEDFDGIGHYFNHWSVSENIFQKYQDFFSLSEEDIYLIRKLILYHDLRIQSSSYNTFLEQFSPDEMDLLFQLKKADILGGNPSFYEESSHSLEKQMKDFSSFRNTSNVNHEIVEMKSRGESVKDVSDTHHSFRDLYEERAYLFALLCNQTEDFAFKSRFHFQEDDDPMFSGDFIAGIHSPEGYVTFHFPMKYWDLFQVVELERAPVYDGHSPEENRRRMLSLIDSKNKVYEKKK